MDSRERVKKNKKEGDGGCEKTKYFLKNGREKKKKKKLNLEFILDAPFFSGLNHKISSSKNKFALVDIYKLSS